MSNREETNLSQYFITSFLGGILTGPGGIFQLILVPKMILHQINILR